jgi:hypothetical protein
VAGTLNVVAGTLNVVAGTLNVVAGTLNVMAGTLNVVAGTLNVMASPNAVMVRLDVLAGDMLDRTITRHIASPRMARLLRATTGKGRGVSG